MLQTEDLRPAECKTAAERPTLMTTMMTPLVTMAMTKAEMVRRRRRRAMATRVLALVLASTNPSF
jgi:hypothetical protein